MGDMWVTECLAALQSSVVRLCVRLSRNKGNAARIVCSILPLVLLWRLEPHWHLVKPEIMKRQNSVRIESPRKEALFGPHIAFLKRSLLNEALMLRLLLDSWLSGDWSAISGDPAKLMTLDS